MKFKELENVFYNNLKDSNITITRACLGTDTYFINCYLAKNESECANNIIDNDILNVMFRIKILGDNDFILENVNNTYKTKPSNEYLYCDYKKVSFRKTNGDINKITKSFENFIKKLIDNLKEDYNNDMLLDTDKELVAKKLSF